MVGLHIIITLCIAWLITLIIRRLLHPKYYCKQKNSRDSNTSEVSTITESAQEPVTTLQPEFENLVSLHDESTETVQKQVTLLPVETDILQSPEGGKNEVSSSGVEFQTTKKDEVKIQSSTSEVNTDPKQETIPTKSRSNSTSTPVTGSVQESEALSLIEIDSLPSSDDSCKNALNDDLQANEREVEIALRTFEAETFTEQKPTPVTSQNTNLMSKTAIESVHELADSLPIETDILPLSDDEDQGVSTSALQVIEEEVIRPPSSATVVETMAKQEEIPILVQEPEARSSTGKDIQRSLEGGKEEVLNPQLPDKEMEGTKIASSSKNVEANKKKQKKYANPPKLKIRAPYCYLVLEDLQKEEPEVELLRKLMYDVSELKHHAVNARFYGNVLDGTGYILVKINNKTVAETLLARGKIIFADNSVKISAILYP